MARGKATHRGQATRGAKGRGAEGGPMRYPTRNEERDRKVASEAAGSRYTNKTQSYLGAYKYLADLAPKYLDKHQESGNPLAAQAGQNSGSPSTYQKTPTNVADEILQYSIPEYAFHTWARSNKGQGNFRQAKLQFAKSIVGYAIGNVADILSRAGVITDEMPKVRQSAGCTIPSRLYPE